MYTAGCKFTASLWIPAFAGMTNNQEIYPLEDPQVLKLAPMPLAGEGRVRGHLRNFVTPSPCDVLMISFVAKQDVRSTALVPIPMGIFNLYRRKGRCYRVPRREVSWSFMA